MKGADTSTDAIAVLVNAATEAQARLIATTLVRERLAACANIVSPISSVYRWKGEVQNETEHLMIIKTRVNLFEKVATRVKELHSYEVPEVIALPIVAGSRAYLDWIFESTAVIAPRRATGKKRRTK